MFVGRDFNPSWRFDMFVGRDYNPSTQNTPNLSAVGTVHFILPKNR
jgi:hypothetical protein